MDFMKMKYYLHLVHERNSKTNGFFLCHPIKHATGVVHEKTDVNI